MLGSSGISGNGAGTVFAAGTIGLGAGVGGAGGSGGIVGRVGGFEICRAADAPAKRFEIAGVDGLVDCDEIVGLIRDSSGRTSCGWQPASRARASGAKMKRRTSMCGWHS